jgi:hypothetical protein
MTTCKKFEKSYTNYVCELLEDEKMHSIAAHLRECPNCAREVDSLKAVLQLTDEAERTRKIPGWALEDIEMKVYKRLASESPTADRTPLLSRLFHLFSFRSPLLRDNDLFSLTARPARWSSPWIWRGAIVSCIFGAVLIVNSIFFNEDGQTNTPVSPTAIQSSRERVNQYFQKELERDLEETFVTRYLSDDDWATTGNLRRLKEQGQGTHLETYADRQLQIAYFGK